MKVYGVNEVYEILKQNKITSNIESVRRWLREGAIEGIAPRSRKEGWKVTEDALHDFLANRLPNTTNDVLTKEEVRAEMWYELVRKNIWEGYIEIKKSQLNECINHMRGSDDLKEEVWNRCVENSSAYSKPRVSYLLEAFGFEGKRLLLDKNYESLEEQALFSIIEYVKKHK